MQVGYIFIPPPPPTLNRRIPAPNHPRLQDPPMYSQFQKGVSRGYLSKLYPGKKPGFPLILLMELLC